MTTLNSNEHQKSIEEMLELAKQYDLHLNSDDIEINESGMDFLVSFAKDEAGAPWILRKPRRTDVWEKEDGSLARVPVF